MVVTERGGAQRRTRSDFICVRGDGGWRAVGVDTPHGCVMVGDVLEYPVGAGDPRRSVVTGVFGWVDRQHGRRMPMVRAGESLVTVEYALAGGVVVAGREDG